MLINDGRVAHQQLGVAWILEMFQLDRFPETCLAAYMAEEYNAAQFITVNVALHFIFCAYGHMFADKQEEYLGFSRLCGVNLETALSTLPLHLPANQDVIVALALGVKGLTQKRAFSG